MLSRRVRWSHVEVPRRMHEKKTVTCRRWGYLTQVIWLVRVSAAVPGAGTSFGVKDGDLELMFWACTRRIGGKRHQRLAPITPVSSHHTTPQLNHFPGAAVNADDIIQGTSYFTGSPQQRECLSSNSANCKLQNSNFLLCDNYMRLPISKHEHA
jgi:hypothetical protein